MLDFNALGSSEKVLLATVVVALLVGLLTVFGFVPWLVARVFRVLHVTVQVGFWIWERVLAGIPWPLLVVLILGVHVLLYFNSGPIVTLLLGFFLLHVGFVCCLAYIAVDQERLDVARGYKALHNPVKGQQLAQRLTSYGSRVGLPLLLVATLACVSGFALLNQGLSESIGANWYAPGYHTHTRRLTDAELEVARSENPPPGYADFLVYSLLNLGSAFDLIDVINLTGMSRVAYVHPNKWPASLMLVTFRVFFTAVLLQQILSFFGKVRLIQESVRDFWSPHEPIRRRAGENLAQLGGRAVENLLRSVELIEYVTPEQRELLLDIIVTVGPSTIPLLTDRLENSRAIVREIAMGGLGRLRALEALPRLVRFRTDAEEGVRLSLVEALEMIADEGPSQSRKRHGLIQRRRRLSRARSTGALSWWQTQVAPPEGDEDPVALTIETLRLLLDDPARVVRQSATRLLGRLREEARSAVQELAGLTHDPEESVREEAVRALGFLGGPVEVTVPALMALIREEQVTRVRVAGLKALSLYRSAAAPAAALLITLVQDREEEIRTAAARTLRRIGPLDASMIPALVSGLHHSDNQVRIQAAEALGTIGSGAAEAVPALIAALHDENDGVRVAVAVALGALGEAAVTALPSLALALRDADSQVAAAAAQALGTIGPAAGGTMASLLKASRHPNAEVRAHVATALARIETEPLAVLPCLVDMTADEDAEVRKAALEGLSGKTSIGTTRHEVFLAALTDESPAVRAVAVTELRQLELPPEELIDRLLEAGDDVSDEVQVQAVRELAQLHPVPLRAIERLCRLLAEDGPRLQLETLRTLGHFGPEAALVVPTLFQMVQRAGTEVRAAVLDAARRIAPQETLLLFLGGLHDSNQVVRLRASEGLLLCQSIPEDQIENLAEAIKDSDDIIRANIVCVCATKNLIRPEMFPLLMACLGEPNDDLRWNALLALGNAPFDQLQEILLRLVSDSNSRVRLLAAARLLAAEPNHSSAAKILKETWQSCTPEERLQVKEALEELNIPPSLFADPS